MNVDVFLFFLGYGTIWYVITYRDWTANYKIGSKLPLNQKFGSKVLYIIILGTKVLEKAIHFLVNLLGNVGFLNDIVIWTKYPSFKRPKDTIHYIKIHVDQYLS